MVVLNSLDTNDNFYGIRSRIFHVRRIRNLPKSKNQKKSKYWAHRDIIYLFIGGQYLT